jgi:hypothetical protein
MPLLSKHRQARLKIDEIRILKEMVSELMEANLKLQARLGQDAEQKVKELLERNSELSRQLKASQNAVSELIRDGLVRNDKMRSKRVDEEREACALLALQIGAEAMRDGIENVGFAMADLARRIRSRKE